MGVSDFNAMGLRLNDITSEDVAMHEGRFVFTQLVHHLPMHIFRRFVAQFDGDRYVKRFACLDQFLCLAFAQLTGREGLRDIEICLRAHQTKLYHLGIRGRVARSPRWRMRTNSVTGVSMPSSRSA